MKKQTKRGRPVGTIRATPKVKVSLSLDETLHRQLAAEAAKDRRTLASYIALLLESRGRE